MPLVPVVGRRAWRVRALIASMYLLLLAGAVTMIYPFTLMLSTALSSNADWREFRLVPRYLFSLPALARKYIVDKAPVATLAFDYQRDDWHTPTDIDEQHLAAILAETTRNRAQIAADYEAFLATVPPMLRRLDFDFRGNADFSVLSIWHTYYRWLAARYRGELKAVNKLYGDTADTWYDLGVPRAALATVWDEAPLSPRSADYYAFLTSVPPARVRLVSRDLLAFLALRQSYGNAAALQQLYGTPFTSLCQVTWHVLTQHTWAVALCESVMRDSIPLAHLRLDPRAADAFAAFCAREFPGAPCSFSRAAPLKAAARLQFIRFARSPACEAAWLQARDPLELWRAWLARRYGSVNALNTAWGTAYAAFDAVPLPAADLDVWYVTRHAAHLRTAFLLGNFRLVFELIFTHGRALLNTLIYIILSIATALTINPMAAYALSRFRLRYAHHILLFLLATMAFPAEVVMIPSFLMVKSFPLGALVVCAAAFALAFALQRILWRRLPLFWSALGATGAAALAAWLLPPWIAGLFGRADLNITLMNTFAALVFPGMANAFAVFLLKGFFDSLPPELYEAGMLDGASEWTMFWRITLPLCKPILAVITLGAFTAAYGAFMFAFLTCQDPKMWTLMVFLYEFQQYYSVPLVMASLVVAAIPTLAVFIACQNIILRGIVIPTFK